MKNKNYKKIGDYIRVVDERNKDLKVETLLGLKITKQFIPSVANTIGTNMRKYKIIRKNQFACILMQVRRDKKVPVALQTEYDEALVSQAYIVFEVKNPKELLPEYLMMWMSRAEFDREACFYAVGGVRGTLEWEDFCNMELPVSTLEKQQEIVDEYNTIINRINLNEQLNQKLEETAQAIYKEWFVNFEFPMTQEYADSIGKPELAGKPYKSIGGEMVWNDELGQEVPKGWIDGKFTDLILIKGGGTPSTTTTEYWDGEIPFFTPSDIDNSIFCLKTEKRITNIGLQKSSTKLYPQNTTFVTARGTVGAIALAGSEMAMNQSCYALLPNNHSNKFYVFQLTKDTVNRLINEAIGAVFKAIVTKDFESLIIIKPDVKTMVLFEHLISSIFDMIYNISKENNECAKIKDLILSKMTKV